MSPALFSPLKIGAIDLSHRVVMAPLTRMRAVADGNYAGEMTVEYYRQRASAGGLIITEASQVMPEGQGYPQTPGIHSPEQVAAWRKVTDAVHAKGGVIFLQLWHVGRVSHSSFQPNQAPPVAPSAVPAAGDHFTKSWKMQPFETPRELSTAEIHEIVEAYRQGARNALEAGFDGVEVHGANGYLIEQFLQTRTNKRTDEYGGSIANRARFAIEVVKAVTEVWGADRVGIRLSPFGNVNDSGEDNPVPLYAHVISALSSFGLAYIHLIERRPSPGTTDAAEPSSVAVFRELWPGQLIIADGFDKTSAEHAVETGIADAVAFGRLFIANPDLPSRFRTGAALNPWDRKTFYGGGQAGYIDYPALDSAPADALASS